MPDASPSRVIGRVVFWFALRRALDRDHLAGHQRTQRLPGRCVRLPAEHRGGHPDLRHRERARGLAGPNSASILGDTPTGKLVATALPVLSMAIAVFMILNQLKIATDIVVITYAALMGAVALGMALAFGLGGSDVASRMLEDAYRSGHEAPAQYRGTHYQRSAGSTAVRPDGERRPAGT